MKPARTGVALLRRSASGLYLGAIALLGMAGFRQAALVGDVVVLSPIAGMWLVGATVTGLISVILLVRALSAHRKLKQG